MASPAWPRHWRAQLSGSPGILSQSEGFLSKFGPISTKTGITRQLICLTQPTKNSLEIIWLYKKSPSSQSGPDTDTGTTFEINLPTLHFGASFYVQAMIAAAFNPLPEIRSDPRLWRQVSQTDRMGSAGPTQELSRSNGEIIIFLSKICCQFFLLLLM